MKQGKQLYNSGKHLDEYLVELSLFNKLEIYFSYFMKFISSSFANISRGESEKGLSVYK